MATFDHVSEVYLEFAAGCADVPPGLTAVDRDLHRHVADSPARDDGAIGAFLLQQVPLAVTAFDRTRGDDVWGGVFKDDDGFVRCAAQGAVGVDRIPLAFRPRATGPAGQRGGVLENTVTIVRPASASALVADGRIVQERHVAERAVLGLAHDVVVVAPPEDPCLAVSQARIEITRERLARPEGIDDRHRVVAEQRLLPADPAVAVETVAEGGHVEAVRAAALVAGEPVGVLGVLAGVDLFQADCLAVVAEYHQARGEVRQCPSPVDKRFERRVAGDLRTADASHIAQRPAHQSGHLCVNAVAQAEAEGELVHLAVFVVHPAIGPGPGQTVAGPVGVGIVRAQVDRVAAGVHVVFALPCPQRQQFLGVGRRRVAVAVLEDAVGIGDVAVERRAGQLAAVDRVIGHDLRVRHRAEGCRGHHSRQTHRCSSCHSRHRVSPVVTPMQVTARIPGSYGQVQMTTPRVRTGLHRAAGRRGLPPAPPTPASPSEHRRRRTRRTWRVESPSSRAASTCVRLPSTTSDSTFSRSRSR